MNATSRLAGHARTAPVPDAALVEGLATGIDRVAERAAASHAFLRRQWYAAAIAAYGGRPRTLLVGGEAAPVLALPLVACGPPGARLAMVPGCYWPFRSFPVAATADATMFDTAVATLERHVRGLRIGPVLDGDAGADALLAAARARGWVTIGRHRGDSWLLELDAGFPRGSTLRKNRFHVKHLGALGALEWRYLAGGDWPAAFATLGAIETRSWIAARTDGSDAKFTQRGHLAFWHHAAADPVLAAMFRGALLRVDGTPAAFSFDIAAGSLRYAIANSFDPAFARHSPGRLLQYRNLQAAQREGVTAVDWGAGDSGYKQVLGARRGAAIRDWLLLRPGTAAMLAPLLRRLWR